MSVVLTARIVPVPERRDELVAAFKDTIAKVHAQDEGCLLYALHECKDGSLLMIEKWTTSEALKAHGSGPVMTAHAAATEGMAQGVTLEFLTPVEAGTTAQGEL